MTLPVARYGAKVIRVVSAVCLALTLAGAFIIGEYALFLLLPIAFAVYFFRDPERRPDDESSKAVIAPADGKVVGISTGTMPFDGVPATKIDIFLSVFDVHINRSPVAGKVVDARYRRGAFLNALKAEAGDANESNTLLLQLEGGQRVAVKQIAGIIARRIVCAVSEGDFLSAGQRFGMIMFGSRTQVFIPAALAFEARVAVGEHVKAGKTVLGYLG